VRLIAFIEYAAVVIGVIAMIAGRFFALRKGFEFGVFMAGAGIALGGLEGLFTRRMGFRSSEDAYHDYAGVPAVIVGLMALFTGAAIVASAYLLADGHWHSTAGYLTRRPGPVLITAGLFVIGIGVLMVLNPRGRRGWAWRLFIYLPRSLLGLILIVGGAAALALGAWEWLDPRAFNDFLNRLPDGRDVLSSVRRLYRSR
jgi:hypothetical protein